jgi:hypothetical protein
LLKPASFQIAEIRVRNQEQEFLTDRGDGSLSRTERIFTAISKCYCDSEQSSGNDSSPSEPIPRRPANLHKPLIDKIKSPIDVRRLSGCLARILENSENQKRRVVDCDSDVPIVIDKQVERYRELLRSLTEQVEVERINQLIARLYAEQ